MLRVLTKTNEFILESGIKAYPIDPDKIINNNKWGIQTYSEARVILEYLGLLDYAMKRKSFAIKSKDGTIMILVRDDLSSGEMYERKIHEIGHIVLSHSTFNNIIGLSEDEVINDKQEAEADRFIIYFAANPYILKNANITIPGTIAKITSLTSATAILASGEIQGNKKNETTIDDIKIAKQFKGFIIKNKLIRKSKPFFVIITVCSIISIIAFYFLNLESDSPTLNVFNQTNIISQQKDIEPVFIYDRYGNKLEESGDYVYVTPDTNEYHYENCKVALINYDKLICMTLDKAVELNYEFCTVCTLDKFIDIKEYYGRSNLDTKYDHTAVESVVDRFGNELSADKEYAYLESPNEYLYHKEDCFYLNNKDTVLVFLLEALIEVGYEPCNVCYE